MADMDRVSTEYNHYRIDMGLRGKIGGYARAAKYSPEELTGAARQGFLKRFEPQEQGLSQEERQRRTQAALRAHMVRLSRLSALARKKQEVCNGQI